MILSFEHETILTLIDVSLDISVANWRWVTGDEMRLSCHISTHKVYKVVDVIRSLLNITVHTLLWLFLIS